MENTSFYHKYFFLFVIAIITVLFSRWPVSLPEDVGSYSKTAITDTQNNGNLVSRMFSFPLVLEENTGRYSDVNRYVSRALGYNLGFAADHVAIVLSGASKGESIASGSAEKVALVFEGASDRLTITGQNRQLSQSHYFRGSADNNHETFSAPHFAGVSYQQIYAGIDVVFYGNQQQLEYDFIVSPGASAETIKLRIDGAQKVELAENGDLLIHTTKGLLRKHAPVAYQEKASARRYVDARFRLNKDNRISFIVGDYDPAIPLTIDPVISFSSYLGGLRIDRAFAVATDSDGDIYIAGNTLSNNFPVKDPFQAAIAPPRAGSGENDAFVTKIDAAGNGIIFSSYLGGDGTDIAYDIAVDGNKNIYLVGKTLSNNFPTTTGAFIENPKRTDGFVTKISASGASLVYSTYLGGGSNESTPGFGESGEARAIDVDSDGNAYITGVTTSDSFPVTTGAFQTSRGAPFADFDAYVSKLNSTGTALVYSTYLGGSDDELLDSSVDFISGDIVVDATGNTYVTGFTKSADFPAASNTIAGNKDVFVVKLNPQGSAADISRYLGGAGDEEGNGIAIDSDGNIIVVGYTKSDDFPVANAFQISNASSGDSNPQDMFISKLDNNGIILFSTYLGGGTNTDEASAVVVDEQNNIYVAGFGAPDFLSLDPITEIEQDNFSAVVVKLDGAGSPIYSTKIARTKSATDLALGNNGQVIVVGATSKDRILVKNAFQDTSGDEFLADTDAFVLKLEPGVDLKVIASATPASLAVDDSVTLSIQVQNISNNDASNVTVSNVLPAELIFQSASAQCVHTAGTVDCSVGDLVAGGSVSLEVVAKAAAIGGLSSTVSVSSAEADTNLVNNQQVLALSVGDVNLQLILGASTATVTVDDNVTLTANVTNNGISTAHSVTFSTTLVGGMSFVSASPQCTELSGIISCDLGSLDAGTVVSIDINVKATAEGVQTHMASVTSDEADVNTADNTSTLDITVNARSTSTGGGGGGSAMSLLFLMLLMLVQGYKRYSTGAGWFTVGRPDL
jgi:uncharacterized repeat protein (TIGR01451 family)